MSAKSTTSALTPSRGASEVPRQPYDVHAKLEDPMGMLSIALGQWQGRDDSRPQPEIRRAANTAMDAIDGMLRDLYAMRSRRTRSRRGPWHPSGCQSSPLALRSPEHRAM